MKKRIVVVDDDKAILDLIQNYLSGCNDYEVELTEKSTDVQNLIDKAKTDLLITDMRMPDLGGAALINEVRKKHPSLKVLSMTAGGVISKEIYLNFAEASGSDYRLEKPFSKENLISSIQHLISTTD